MYLLDTDHLSLFQRNHPQVTQHLLSKNPNLLATSIVSYEEQVWGRLNRIRQAKDDIALLRAYKNLEQTLNFFQNIQLVNLDAVSLQIFRQLRSEGVRIGTQDLRIASIALRHQMIVVTRNHKDFSKVPQLHLEDWSF
jgi:tRNA(fMet)-specific endonuclease VapC